MSRALIKAIALFHLGPGIAFLLLAFGCDGIDPSLGSACSGGALRSFGVLTLLSWLAIGALLGFQVAITRLFKS